MFKCPHELIVDTALCGQFNACQHFVCAFGVIEYHTKRLAIVWAKRFGYVDFFVSVVVEFNSVACAKVNHKLVVIATVVVPGVPKERFVKVVKVVDCSASIVHNHKLVANGKLNVAVDVACLFAIWVSHKVHWVLYAIDLDNNTFVLVAGDV